LTFVFKHPSYYKNLATNCRRDKTTQKGKDEKEASSDKQQASSDKRSETEQDSN